MFTAMKAMLIEHVEARGILKKSNRNPYEAWRLRKERFDPLTAGVEAASLNNILNPKQVASNDKVATAIEAWEDLQRRFEKKKRRFGSHRHGEDRGDVQDTAREVVRACAQLRM